MPHETTPSNDVDEAQLLTQEVRALRAELARLNSHRFVRIHNNMARLVLFQLLRGMALGLGTALGASVLLSIMILLLNQIEFVPILGDLASGVIDEIERAQTGGFAPQQTDAPGPAVSPETPAPTAPPAQP